MVVRVHRLIAIMLLIESRGRIKANELAAALETSVRSIYRDIDVLAEAGIPIVTATGPNGGISLMEGYIVNLKQLNGDELVHLYLTGLGFHHGRQKESTLKLKNAMLKLEKTLPPAYREDITKAKNVFISMRHRGGTNRLCSLTLSCSVQRSGKGVRPELNTVRWTAGGLSGICSRTGW